MLLNKLNNGIVIGVIDAGENTYELSSNERQC